MAGRAVKAFGKAGGAGAAGAGAAEPGEQETPAGGNKPLTESERSVIVGGPGMDAPTFQPIKYGDREFKTQDELTGYLDELNNERTTLKKKIETKTEPSAAAAAATPQPITLPDYITDDDLKGIAEEDFLTKPKEVLKGLLGKVGQNVEKRLTTQYNAQKVMDQWWTNFFDSNKDLSKHKNIVQMVFQANSGELASLTMDKASERLADLTRDTILQVSGGEKSARPEKQPGNKAVVEGSGGRLPARSQEEEQPQIRSLTGVLKARQAARRKAQVA